MKSTDRIRFSIIDYLNALPLNLAFKDGLFERRAELIFDYPSQCADNLAAHRADVGLISSIEYQRIPDLRIAPHICIASKHEVRSVLILTKMELKDVRRVALDRFSRSSVALLRILFHRRYQSRPQFVTMTPLPERMLEEADAALVIGDAALRLEPGDYRRIDLASEWFAETGLPFVFAFWAIRGAFATPEVVGMLLEAKQYGMSRIEERVGEIQRRWPLAREEILRYFSRHIHFDLEQQELASLSRFYRYAREAGLIHDVTQPVFAPSPS